jgi:hypothetical protein
MLNVSATISNLGSVEMLCNFGIFHLPCDKLHEKFHLSICTGGDCNMFRLFIIAIFREHWRTKDNLQLLIYKQYFLHNFLQIGYIYLRGIYLPTDLPIYLCCKPVLKIRVDSVMRARSYYLRQITFLLTYSQTCSPHTEFKLISTSFQKIQTYEMGQWLSSVCLPPFKNQVCGPVRYLHYITILSYNKVYSPPINPTLRLYLGVS